MTFEVADYRDASGVRHVVYWTATGPVEPALHIVYCEPSSSAFRREQNS